MKVSDAVAGRQAVRAFKPDPVAGTLVREILDLARNAPSGGNLQPWRVYAWAGEPLAKFKATVKEKVRAEFRASRQSTMSIRRNYGSRSAHAGAKPAHFGIRSLGMMTKTSRVFRN